MGAVLAHIIETSFNHLFRSKHLAIKNQPGILAQAAHLAARQRNMDDPSHSERSGSASDNDNPPTSSHIIPLNDSSESEEVALNDVSIQSKKWQSPQSFIPGTSKRSLSDLVWQTKTVCSLTMEHEIPQRKIHRREISGNLPMSDRVAMINQHLPNSRKIVNSRKIGTKTFCSYYTSRSNILTASQDGFIRFYSRGTCHNGRYSLDYEMPVPVLAWSILDIATSRDQRYMAYGTWRDDIFIGTLRNEESLPTCEWNRITIPISPDDVGPTAVFSLRISHDGREVLCGTTHHNIHLFDLEKEKCTVTLEAHEDHVNAVCYENGGSLLYSAGDDGLCKVWDRRSMHDSDEPIGIFAGHRDGITSIDSKGDDRYILTNSKDQTIKVWDLRRFASRNGIDATRTSVSKQTWNYAGGGYPGKSYGGLLDGDCSIGTFFGHSVRHTLIRSRFSPPSTGGRFIYTGCAKGDVVIYDTITGDIVTRLRGHRSVVRDCHWNDDTNELVSSGWDGDTFVWSYDSRKKSDYRLMRMNSDEESTDEYWVETKTRQRKKMQRKRRLQNSVQPGSSIKRIPLNFDTNSTMYRFDPYDTYPDV